MGNYRGQWFVARSLHLKTLSNAIAATPKNVLRVRADKYAKS